MSDALTFVDRNLGRFRAELYDFLRIPSVSAKSEHDDDTRAAAEWLADRLRDAGLGAEIHDTPGHPIVVGRWSDAGEDAPTVLIYGHYDVQPPEPLELWTSPPFEPEVREERVYARGATDNKGQLFVHLKALQEILARDGALPVNVVILAEGEEEIASPNLLPVLERMRERLRADAFLISDSSMFADQQPSLLLSLRGLAYFEVRLRGTAKDLHSGIYGGAVPNAATAMADVLSSLHDDRGTVAVDGFYDDVVAWDPDVLEGINTLPFDEAEMAREVGARPSGETGYSTLERLWLRPTCEVNGILSGYTGEGAKTVIPSRAMAKVSTRLVPDQDPDDIAEKLEAHLRARLPDGVALEFLRLHGGRPWRAHPSGPFFSAATRALEGAFGVAPVLVGEGASIPIVADLERVLGAQGILMGLSVPGVNMHAPDEWFPVAHLELGIDAVDRFYRELAATSRADIETPSTRP